MNYIGYCQFECKKRIMAILNAILKMVEENIDSPEKVKEIREKFPELKKFDMGD